MDALQADIDTLEQEKIDLKERLKVLSKKTLLEGLTRQTSQSGIAATVAKQGQILRIISSWLSVLSVAKIPSKLNQNMLLRKKNLNVILVHML